MEKFIQRHPAPWHVEETPKTSDGCNILDNNGDLVDYDVELEYANILVHSVNTAYAFMLLCESAPPIHLMEQLGDLNQKARATLL